MFITFLKVDEFKDELKKNYDTKSYCEKDLKFEYQKYVKKTFTYFIKMLRNEYQCVYNEMESIHTFGNRLFFECLSLCETALNKDFEILERFLNVLHFSNKVLLNQYYINEINLSKTQKEYVKDKILYINLICDEFIKEIDDIDWTKFDDK